MQDIPKNHFVMAEADIDDRIKRKRIRNDCCDRCIRPSYSSSRHRVPFAKFLPLDRAVDSRAVFIIVSESDGRVEMVLEASYLKR